MRITPQNFPDPERGRIFTSFCQHTFYWGKNSWLGGFNLPLVQSCNLVPAATLHLTITKKRFFLIIVKSLLCGIKNVVRWNYYYYVCLVCPGLEVKILSFDRFVTCDIDNWPVESWRGAQRGVFGVSGWISDGFCHNDWAPTTTVGDSCHRRDQSFRILLFPRSFKFAQL